jgi:hypothetical protein
MLEKMMTTVRWCAAEGCTTSGMAQFMMFTVFLVREETQGT